MWSNIYIAYWTEYNICDSLLYICYIYCVIQRVPTSARCFHPAVALCMAIIVPKQGFIDQWCAAIMCCINWDLTCMMVQMLTFGSPQSCALITGCFCGMWNADYFVYLYPGYIYSKYIFYYIYDYCILIPDIWRNMLQNYLNYISINIIVCSPMSGPSLR